MSDPLDTFEAFTRAVRSRLDAGREAYGDRSFSADPSVLVAELQQEARDLAGWGFVLWTRLERMRAALATLDDRRVHVGAGVQTEPADHPKHDKTTRNQAEALQLPITSAGRCGTFPIILVALLAIGCGDAADAAVDASDGAFCGWTSADVTFEPRDELECVRWVETLPGFHGCRDCRPCDVPDRAASCSVALPGEQIRVFVANGQPSVELEAVAYWLTDDGSCPVDCGD